jgi:hypothetical protein
MSGGGTIWLRAQGERARLRVQMCRGKWASRAWALKGQGRAKMVGKRTDVGRVHDGGVDGRLGTGSHGWVRGAERG